MERYLLLVTMLVTSFLVAANQGSSQNYKDEYMFINYGEDYGVYDPDVIAFEQDSTGYFWIATNNGLFRYDGQYFDSYTHLSNDTLSIPDNKVTAVEYDTLDNVIWVGTYFGEISSLNLTSYTFNNHKKLPVISNLNGIGRVTSIARYNKDWLIISTLQSGLYFYNLTQNKYVKSDELGFKLTRIRQIIKVDSTAYVATSQGVFCTSIKNDHIDITKVKGLNTIQHVSSMRVKGNQMTLTNGRSLYLFNINTKQLETIYNNESTHRFTSHQVDDEGNYWIGTNGSGVLNVTAKGELICHYTADVTKNMTLNTDWINDIYISNQQHIVWVGGKGSLGYFNKQHFKFRQKVINDNGRGDRIYLLFKDSQNCYWYYSRKGVYRSDANGLNYKVIKYGEEQRDLIDRVFEIYEDENQNVWLASEIGLIKYDLKTNKSILLNFEKDKIRPELRNRISSVKPYGENTLWLSSYKGVIKIDKDTYHYTVYPYNQKDDKFFYRTNRLCVFDDSTLLVGTDESVLLKFNINNSSYKYIDVNYQFGQLEKNCYVLDVYKDQHNQVWLATYGLGLMQYCIKNDSVFSATNNQALNLDVYGILEDNQGMLWMSTNTQIVKFNPTNKKLTSYSSLDGVNVLEFNDCAFSQSKDGTMLFGGFGGFMEFNPLSIVYNNEKPKVKISSYKLDSKVYENEYPGEIDVEYYIPDTIVISTDEKKVSFFASVFSYTQSYKNMAAWKLEGYDATWDTLTAYSDKTYGSLPEGSYKLLLKGSNNDGIWSDVGDSVVVIVKPTFYKSRLFLILMVVFSIAILYLIYYLRGRVHKHREQRLQYLIGQSTSKLKKSNEELENNKEEMLAQKAELERHRNYLEELVQERTADLELARMKAEESDRLKTAFLANLSHEIRTPMNSIVGFSSLLSSNVHEEEDRNEFVRLIQQSSDSLLVLIDDIIDISRIESGQLHLVKKDFKVLDLCQTVYKSLIVNESLFKDADLKLDLEGISETTIIQSDWERLKQVLFNLLNNALKFTADGYVKLTVRETSILDRELKQEMLDHIKFPDQFVLFTVEDTGIGIKEEDFKTIFNPFVKIEDRKINYAGMGLGLSIVKQLVQALGGEIWLSSTLGKGTIFYFYLPYA
nr:ATP-binding protein [uncultured Carboxylicivirga sp.]